MFHNNRDNFKIAQAKGQTWDLLLFVYFISQKQCLRPLSCCAPLTISTFRVRVIPLFLHSMKNLTTLGNVFVYEGLKIMKELPEFETPKK